MNERLNIFKIHICNIFYDLLHNGFMFIVVLLSNKFHEFIPNEILYFC